MLNFLKSAFTRTSGNIDAEALVDDFARQTGRLYPFDLKSFPAGVKFLSAEPQVQREIAMTMALWLTENPTVPYNQNVWKMREAFFHILKRKLPFTEQDVVTLLNWSTKQEHTFYRGVPQMIKVAGDYLKSNPMSDEIHRSIEGLIQSIESQYMSVENRRWILRLKELTGDSEISLPLEAGDVWADTALSELRSLDLKIQTVWAELLLCCLRTTGSAPSSKWLKGVDKYLTVIRISNFFNQLLHWFPLVDKPRPAPSNRYDNVQTLLPVNADILKGLAWLCSKSDNPEIARALTA